MPRSPARTRDTRLGNCTSSKQAPPPRHVPVDTALAAWNADSEASRAIRSLMQDGGDSTNPRAGV
jgi:hypothetical protein